VHHANGQQQQFIVLVLLLQYCGAWNEHPRTALQMPVGPYCCDVMQHNVQGVTTDCSECVAKKRNRHRRAQKHIHVHGISTRRSFFTYSLLMGRDYTARHDEQHDSIDSSEYTRQQY
jgi:hypothetical protein